MSCHLSAPMGHHAWNAHTGQKPGEATDSLKVLISLAVIIHKFLLELNASTRSSLLAAPTISPSPNLNLNFRVVNYKVVESQKDSKEEDLLLYLHFRVQNHFRKHFLGGSGKLWFRSPRNLNPLVSAL